MIPGKGRKGTYASCIDASIHRTLNMSQEIIEHHGKKVPVYEWQSGRHPCQGGENIAYTIWASLTRAFALFATINDPRLGKSVLRFKDMRRVDDVLDQVIQGACDQAG